MCSGSRNKLRPTESKKMEAGLLQEDQNCSKLFELAATDDLNGFKHQVEEMGCDVNQVGFWFGRSFGSKEMMSFEQRTPIMVASLYGSTEVLKYIIGTNRVDVNKPCGSDRATALHCAAAGGSWSSVEVVQILIEASADINAVDVNGKKPGDLIPSRVKSSNNSKSKTLEMLLSGIITTLEEEDEEEVEEIHEKKEYPFDVTLPDINNGIYGSDEFRMYSFKVKPCSRAYSHDWTECPFVHPGENARRRDPMKHHYTCVPCLDFKKGGTCVKGDGCEYAHGVFEQWLHPSQYRTRLCKDETSCSRKVCFFAHRKEDLRPLYASTGSAMPSPPKSVPLDFDMGLMGLEKIHTRQRQQLVEEMAASLSSSPYRSSRIGDLSPKKNLDEIFGSLDPSFLSRLQGLSPKYNNIIGPNLQSPKGPHARQNSRYPLNMNSSSAAPVAAAGMNSRSAAFTNRSQHFIDRSGGGGGGGYRTLSHGQSKLSEWCPPDGQVNWGYNGEDVNKFRKYASFGYRNGNVDNGFAPAVINPTRVNEADVNPVVKDGEQRDRVDDGIVDQMYIGQEQVVSA